MRPTARLLLATAGIVTLLAACGGGGDGGSVPPPAPPTVTITSQPTDLVVEEGAGARFTVGIAANTPYDLEWLRNGIVVSTGRSLSTTSVEYVLAAASLDDDGTTFAVRLSYGVNNASGSTTRTTVTSNTVRLTVNMTPPQAPSRLQVLSGGTVADIIWDISASNATGFELYRWINGQDVRIATLGPAPTLPYTLAGLRPGLQETLRVRAVRSAAGRTAYSDFVSTTFTQPGTVPPAAPTNARLRYVPASNALELIWTDNSNDETSFEIQWRDPNFWITVNNIAANSTSTRLDGLSLTPGTHYTYRVRAVRSANGQTVRSEPAVASITLPNPGTEVIALTPIADTITRTAVREPLPSTPLELGCVYTVSSQLTLSSNCALSLIKFDIGLVSGRTVRRATLRLQPLVVETDFLPTLQWTLGAAQQAWDPATFNWSTTLFVGPSGMVTQPLSPALFPLHVDVTAIVSRWVSGTQDNHGFALYLAASQDSQVVGQGPGTYRMRNVFGSSENTIASNLPQLEIEYE